MEEENIDFYRLIICHSCHSAHSYTHTPSLPGAPHSHEEAQLSLPLDRATGAHTLTTHTHSNINTFRETHHASLSIPKPLKHTNSDTYSARNLNSQLPCHLGYTHTHTREVHTYCDTHTHSQIFSHCPYCFHLIPSSHLSSLQNPSETEAGALSPLSFFSREEPRHHLSEYPRDPAIPATGLLPRSPLQNCALYPYIKSPTLQVKGRGEGR